VSETGVSEDFPLPIFETLYGGRCGFREILRGKKGKAKA
jgi:hypothetical protein